MAQVSDQASDPAVEVDIPKAFCAQIRDFARRLPDMTYYEVLGVMHGCDFEAIRHAFFERSKTFHPDRYFNKKLGAYEPLLHEIYKRVVGAHEVLRDEKLRADYDKTLRESPGFRIGTPSYLLGLPGAEKQPRNPGSGQSLRERSGFARGRSLADLELRLHQSRKKARAHFESAKQEQERGDWVRASSLVRLALAFDPREQEYHRALADIGPRANSEQAELARAKGEMLLSRGQAGEALPFLEEAFALVPTDPDLGCQIAVLLRGDPDTLARAADFARQAVELDEGNPEYRKTLGMILKDQGLLTEARKELQRAWELDPMDREVKQALSVL